MTKNYGAVIHDDVSDWKLNRIRGILDEVPFEKISLREQRARLDLALELLAKYQDTTEEEVLKQLSAY